MVSSRQESKLLDSMLVLGVAESEASENVIELRELELEERWKRPIFTMSSPTLSSLPIFFETECKEATIPIRPRTIKQDIHRKAQEK